MTMWRTNDPPTAFGQVLAQAMCHAQKRLAAEIAACVGRLADFGIAQEQISLQSSPLRFPGYVAVVVAHDDGPYVEDVFSINIASLDHKAAVEFFERAVKEQP